MGKSGHTRALALQTAMQWWLPSPQCTATESGSATEWPLVLIEVSLLNETANFERIIITYAIFKAFNPLKRQTLLTRIT